MPVVTTPAIDHEVTRRLRIAVLRLSRLLRQQAEGDITPSVLSALSSVEHRGPLTIGDLATIENVTPPTMTRIVDRLESMGWVERCPDPDDRRVVRVKASRAGRAYAESARERYSAFLADRMDGFTAKELSQLKAALPLLERLVEGAE